MASPAPSRTGESRPLLVEAGGSSPGGDLVSSSSARSLDTFKDLLKHTKGVFDKLLEEEKKENNSTMLKDISFHTLLKGLDRFDQWQKEHTEKYQRNKDYLQRFDHDNNDRFGRDEFIDLVVQIDIDSRQDHPEERRMDFLKAMWQWQAKKHTKTAIQALLNVKEIIDGEGIEDMQDCEAKLKEKMEPVKDVWKKVTPEFFLQAIKNLPEDKRAEFLDSLVLDIPLEEDEAYLKVPGLGKPGVTLPAREVVSRSICVIMVESEKTYPITAEQEGALQDEQLINSSRDNSDAFRLLEEAMGGRDSRPWFGYTTVNISPRVLQDYPGILLVIAASHPESDITDCLIMKGMLSRAWCDIQANFYIGLLMECVYVLMLIWVAGEAREKKLPPLVLVLFIVVFAVCAWLIQMTEIAAALTAAMETVLFFGDTENFSARGSRLTTLEYEYGFGKACRKVFVLFVFLSVLLSLVCIGIGEALTGSPDHQLPPTLTLLINLGTIMLATLSCFALYFLQPERTWSNARAILVYAVLCLLLVAGTLYLLCLSVFVFWSHSAHEKACTIYLSSGVAWGLLMGCVYSYIEYFPGCGPCCMKNFIMMRDELRGIKNHITIGSFWTCFEFIMAIYGMIMVSGFIYGYVRLYAGSTDGHYDLHEPFVQVDGTFTHKHPAWIAMFICFKMQQVIQKMLCIRSIGESVIPAYNALLDKRSFRVILFMMLIWLNSFFTYYALPVYLVKGTDENGNIVWSRWWDNVWQMALTMYRLDLSGDFSLDHLEGLHDQVVLQKTNHSTWSGIIDESVDFQPWHKCIGVMYMVFSLFVTVGLLNVYIGIVSNLYNEKVKRSKEYFEIYRAVYIYKAMITRRATEEVVNWLTCGFSRKFLNEHSDDNDANGSKPGVWLMYHPQERRADVTKQERLRKQVLQEKDEEIKRLKEKDDEIKRLKEAAQRDKEELEKLRTENKVLKEQKGSKRGR